MNHKRTLVFLICALSLLPYAQSQNSTSTPFSVFGIGEIETRDFGRTTGMSSVGIGLQSENFLNRLNPAGIAGIDTLRFILDVSVGMKISELFNTASRGRTTDFNFKSLAVGVRLSQRWTSSVGLAPYSNVGYQQTVQMETIGSAEYVNATYSGSGGLNKFYWTKAYNPVGGLSLGMTSSLVFGNITHTAEEDIITIKDTYNASKINFDFGMQYSHWFDRHTNVIVGAVYGYKSPMNMERTQMTVSYNSIVRNERMPDLKTYIPETYGAGFSVLHNRNDAEWILAADYKETKWSADRSRHKYLRYADSRILSAGLQFTPSTRPTNYVQFMRFKIGGSYHETYLKVNGYQLVDYSLSFGVGLPFYNQLRQTLSYVNVAVNVGESATGKRGGITERYVLLSLNMSLIERWFAKHQWQ